MLAVHHKMFNVTGYKTKQNKMFIQIQPQ